MANAPVAVTRDQILSRAKSVIGKGVYKLGRGGRVPANPTPFQDGQCDCSGFAAWCLGIDRYQPKKIAGGDWVETTAVYSDAQKEAGLFAKVTCPQPGDVIVYPDRGGKQGHIGIVSAVEDGKVTKAIHCASRQMKPGAVQETAPDVFTRNNAICARFKLIVQ